MPWLGPTPIDIYEKENGVVPRFVVDFVALLTLQTCLFVPVGWTPCLFCICVFLLPPLSQLFFPCHYIPATGGGKQFCGQVLLYLPLTTTPSSFPQPHLTTYPLLFWAFGGIVPTCLVVVDFELMTHGRW